MPVPPNLGKFAPGHYDVTWDGNSLGLTETPHDFVHTVGQEEITSDDYGPSTPIDTIYNGQRIMVSCRFLEWDVETLKLLNVFAQEEQGVLQGEASDANANPLGQLGSNAAKTMVFTAKQNTPAAEYGPVSRTALRAIPMPGQEISYQFGVTRRILPISFLFLPYKDTDQSENTVRFFKDVLPTP